MPRQFGVRITHKGVCWKEDIQMYTDNDISKMSIEEVVDRIIHLNKGMYKFWSEPVGWSPTNAAELLSKSRLDWQLSLTLNLKNWINKVYVEDDYANLILAWVNIGSLVEGTIKLALSVYYNNYLNDTDIVISRGQIQGSDTLMLDKLRTFCKGKLWHESSKLDSWILHIQQRRNVIHAYKDRELGNFSEFYNDLKEYLEFLRLINGKLPYPDGIFEPREC